MANLVEWELYRRLADEAGRQYAGGARKLPSQTELGKHFDDWLTRQGHKLQGATKATIDKLRRVFLKAVTTSAAKRKNPADKAAAVSEGFHGEAPKKTHDFRVVEHVHKHLAGLGTLISLRVRPLGGGGAVDIEAPADGPQKVLLACSEDRSTLYFVGGNQELDPARFGLKGNAARKDRLILGELVNVVYRTRKGIDKFELADYVHKVGRKGKGLPFLGYDPRSKLMYVEGGCYVVENRGIVD